MTTQALVVSVETGINTVNAEKGPDTLPLNITALDPVSISIKDQGSRLNNKVNTHINDVDLYIRDGNWNDSFQQNLSSTNINISNANDIVIDSFINDVDLYIRDGNWNDSFKNTSSSKNIIIQDSTDTIIEKELSSAQINITDSSSLNLFEGNGDSVSINFSISKTTAISSQGPLYDGNNWDILTASAIDGTETILDIGSSEGTPTGVKFKSDGTVLFFSGYSGDAIYATPTSTAWDISTANMSSVTSTGSLGYDVKDFYIKPDGTSLWVSTPYNIREYSMSTPWDLTTVSLSQSTSVSNNDNSTAGGLWFKPDGTEMYYNDATSDLFSQYTLTTAWDISTKTSYKSISTSGESAPQGMALSSDGTIVYVVGSSGDGIDYYTLSTPWDISTRSSSAGFYSLAGITSVPTGIHLRSDDSVLYVSFRATGTINTTIADGILQLPFGDGSVVSPTVYSKTDNNSITYDSTGDITIVADNFDKTSIFVSKDITTFRNLSYYTTEKTINISHNTNTIEDTSYSPLRFFTSKNLEILSNSSYSINNVVINTKLDTDEYRDGVLKNIQITTADDIAARSPSFCNSIQKSFYIDNEVPIGYFEVDGIAQFSDINKNNDPRLVGGSTQTDGTGDTGGTGGTGGTGSGPIQSWSS